MRYEPIPVELGRHSARRPGHRRILLSVAALGPGLDHCNRPVRLGHRPGHRHAGRRRPHRAQQGCVRPDDGVRGTVPQRAADRADVPVVFRFSRIPAGDRQQLGQAEHAAAGVFHRSDRTGLLHLGPGGRAGAYRHPDPVARTKERRSGPRPDAGADLPLRDATHGLPHHRAAADQRVHEHLQELGRGAGDRPDRTHFPDAADDRRIRSGQPD